MRKESGGRKARVAVGCSGAKLPHPERPIRACSAHAAAAARSAGRSWRDSRRLGRSAARKQSLKPSPSSLAGLHDDPQSCSSKVYESRLDIQKSKSGSGQKSTRRDASLHNGSGDMHRPQAGRNLLSAKLSQLVVQRLYASMMYLPSLGTLSAYIPLLGLPAVFRTANVLPLTVNLHSVVHQAAFQLLQIGVSQKPPSLPVLNPTKSFWTHGSRDANPLARAGSEDALTDDADVCIVGSGITGVSAAYHLAKALEKESAREAPLKAVILEARDFCACASFIPSAEVILTECRRLRRYR